MSTVRKNRLVWLTKEEQVELMFDLINSFRLVRKPVETALFLQDLLTANEIRNLAIRLRIAKLIVAGKSHREIQDKLRTSLATITKVRSWLERGGDGLKSVIAKLPEKWDIPDDLPRGPLEFHLPQTILAIAEHSIASSQNKEVEVFISNVKDKSDIDKRLQKIFDGYYQEKDSKIKAKRTERKFVEKIKNK